ncbi:hypothetical protein NQ315_000046 [Exocentrus adspersus]|uniref:Tc1-like transposase DDE domain-containing protein n=1 Tax=Exocentrus adspersus TaxID=1586481 RepID=A0AAV8VFK1_9CUCU|nr:hypothetical protein NQ315_000046 [Exocentrus adspersus]
MAVNIPHDPTCRKFELFELVQLHRPPDEEKNYKIDNILKLHGHTRIRTPPYMCELNPIELAWTRIKHLIRCRNTTGEFSINALKEATQEAIKSITEEEWIKYCQHVIKIEDNYWENDQLLEEVQPLNY